MADQGTAQGQSAVSNPAVGNTVTPTAELGGSSTTVEESSPVRPYSVPVAGGWAYVCGTGHAHGTYGAAERCERPVESRYVVSWDFARYVPRTWKGTRQCAVFGMDNTGITVTAASADEAVRQCGETHRLNPYYLTATRV